MQICDVGLSGVLEDRARNANALACASPLLSLPAVRPTIAVQPNESNNCQASLLMLVPWTCVFLWDSTQLSMARSVLTEGQRPLPPHHRRDL